jgi:hypothetical protein
MHPDTGTPQPNPEPVQVSQQQPEARVPPVSAHVQVVLEGATEGARVEFAKAVQSYGDRLAREAEKQEISNRPDGAMFPELTANSVVRAKDVLDRFGLRAKRKPLEITALVGLTIFSGAVGVVGSYLNSAWQWAVLSGCIFLAIICIGYLVARRSI